MTNEATSSWKKFLLFAKSRTSAAAYNNWLAPVSCLSEECDSVTLEVPNIFVKEYLISNYEKELRSFLPLDADGNLAITFVVAPKNAADTSPAQPTTSSTTTPPPPKLNNNYRFSNFIEGPSNQFVKSAAIGVATHPGKSYNPLFIHGSVGLGKTHILHAIGHQAYTNNKKVRVQCITTEAFINEIVDHLRNKTIDKFKLFYRSDIDVLLIDDIQFLQSRLNFEEEFCNMFEALINQKKQVVITSDQPPSRLKLSQRMIARMEWGLVAHMGAPELETRVAILQQKAHQRGIEIPCRVAFYIAEHIYNNVRQLEGAVNTLSAYHRLMNIAITEQLVQECLKEVFQTDVQLRVTADQIIKGVAAVFEVKVSDLKGAARTQKIALPRQVAMYLACRMLNDSLQSIGHAFGKTHSTLLHACKAIEKRLQTDSVLQRQISMIEANLKIAAAA